MTLTPAQAAAIQYVRMAAVSSQAAARERMVAVLERSAQLDSVSDALFNGPLPEGRVTLSFHPDRPLPRGTSVAESMLVEGRYRNQFETGYSNGSRTAYVGGERDHWEGQLFGGAFQARGVGAEERPKYGGLNLMRHPDGACPRFGSCYFTLRPRLLSRCTFTWGDSHLDPTIVGTADIFEPLLAALFDSVEASATALGKPSMSVPRLLALLSSSDEDADRGRATSPVGRALDDYIEAQVHGEIDLGADVSSLTCDPAFQGTETEACLRAIAERYGFPLLFHPGFVLTPEKVPDNFRGPKMRPFARRLADDFAGSERRLDAVVLGRAALALHQTPDVFQDWADPGETFQHIKQMWHVLVQFGLPSSVGPGSLVA